MQLGDTLPELHVDTTQGPLNLSTFIGDAWGILFSHPADFTPVCTTELATVARLASDFKERGVKVLALSCDSTASHQQWIKDIEAVEHAGGHRVEFPIIADEDRSIATRLGMLEPGHKDASGLPLTCRGVFVVDPHHRIRLILMYPASLGRNFDEILRAIDSLQLTDKSKCMTPANWQRGQACMLPAGLSEKEAQRHPGGCHKVELPSKKGYMRTTDPRAE